MDNDAFAADAIEVGILGDDSVDRYEHNQSTCSTMVILPAPSFFPVDELVTIGVAAFLSAAALLVLYSILFCSKLGSFRYSSRAPARDTGAWKENR